MGSPISKTKAQPAQSQTLKGQIIKGEGAVKLAAKLADVKKKREDEKKTSTTEAEWETIRGLNSPYN